jgi:hypothetical protein
LPEKRYSERAASLAKLAAIEQKYVEEKEKEEKPAPIPNSDLAQERILTVRELFALIQVSHFFSPMSIFCDWKSP